MLQMLEPGRLVLIGPVTFDNAAAVAAEGEAVLSNCFSETAQGHCEINLAQMEVADSSALSVFLSWMRFAKKRQATICFSAIPAQLEALANVCDMKALMDGVSCELY